MILFDIGNLCLNIFKVQLLFVLMFVNVDRIGAQSIQLRENIGVQAEWKGARFSVFNMNFFSTEGSWVQNNTRFTVRFPSKSNLNFGMGYQRNYSKYEREIRVESRPLIFMLFRKRYGDFELMDLSTLEFRFVAGNTLKRFRNLVGFRLEKFDSLKPYISTEAFFYFDGFDYTRQRLTFGTWIPIKKIRLDFFGFYEVNKDELMWTESMAFGTIFIYRFS